MFTLYGLENAGANEQMLGRVEWASSVLQRMPTSVLQSVVREERPPATSEAAGNVSERKVMTIDIHPGDTFTIWTNGAILQYRNDTTRWLGDDVWATGSTSRCHDERELCPATARQIILAAGHTITEAQPQPTPVKWPTHAVVGKVNGVVYRMGTKDQCDLWIKETSLSCDSHEVRPLAPAPMSDKMRALIDALDNAAYCGWTDDARAELRKAARALLAEGGAA
jgi:hypothetical protein